MERTTYPPINIARKLRNKKPSGKKVFYISLLLFREYKLTCFMFYASCFMICPANPEELS